MEEPSGKKNQENGQQKDNTVQQLNSVGEKRGEKTHTQGQIDQTAETFSERSSCLLKTFKP